MEKKLCYLVLWMDIVVGKIYCNNEGKYIYYPDYDNIITASEKYGMPKVFIMEPQTKWGNLSPFFKERINIGDKGLKTDRFHIKKVKKED